MPEHPDLASEQAYVDHAYECLEASRVSAARLGDMVEVGRGGTTQARWEREVFQESVLDRLAQLDIGDASLVFGRTDAAPSRPAPANGGDSPPSDDVRADEGRFYIGRIPVADADQEPLVVDWRAPVAEPFYRATGSDPMGLRRRRHFASRGRTLLGIDDEEFVGAVPAPNGDRIRGRGALEAALDAPRTGRLADIAGTIQAEQDEVIRSGLEGIVIVQGGPGTGKTVVALHRAAYLLYTHRFPLDGQGVVVVGPNRLFLGYIEQVLPSLGEAGVELAVLADLYPHAEARATEDHAAARTKGDKRMIEVLRQAVRDRQRPLRSEFVIGYGLASLRLSVDRSAGIVRAVQRRSRLHNAGRRRVEAAFFAALAERVPASAAEVTERIEDHPDIRAALEWMWPVLSPEQFLHDLYGSTALVRSASRRVLDADEREGLHRPRESSVDEVAWTAADIPLLDEALVILGPAPDREGGVRTYGHIVVDEAQDLSPMELRVLRRRSLNGSMTLVGDIAQATGAWPHQRWESVLEELPDRRGSRQVELTIGYRTPAPIMNLARRVLAVAAPDISPPTAVRDEGEPPEVIGPVADVVAAVVAATVEARADVSPGSVGVICPPSLVDEVDAALTDAGVEHGQATRHGLDNGVTVVPVRLVKGLELDATVVVEPSRIVAEQPQGLRALYVALTRATQRLTVVHAEALPEVLVEI